MHPELGNGLGVKQFVFTNFLDVSTQFHNYNKSQGKTFTTNIPYLEHDNDGEPASVHTWQVWQVLEG